MSSKSIKSLFILLIALFFISCGEDGPQTSNPLDKQAGSDIGVGISSQNDKDEDKSSNSENKGSESEGQKEEDEKKLAIERVSKTRFPDQTDFSIKLYGSGFKANMSVKLGEIERENLIYINEEMLIADFAGMAEGSYELKLESADLKASYKDKIEIFAKPELESLTPNIVYKDTLQEFELKGKKLSNLEFVTIADCPTLFKSQTDSLITLIRKPCNDSNNLHLVLSSKDFQKTFHNYFKVRSKLEVNRINPVKLIRNEDQDITFYGRGFVPAIKVFIGANELERKRILFISENEIRLKLNLAVAAGEIRFLRDKQEVTLKNPFSIIDPASMQFEISPEKIPALSSNFVSIYSLNLANELKGVKLKGSNKTLNFELKGNNILRVAMPPLSKNEDRAEEIILEKNNPSENQTLIINYFKEPIISSISPSPAKTNSTIKLLVKGDGLEKVDSFEIGRVKKPVNNLNQDLELDIDPLLAGSYKLSLFKYGFLFPQEESIDISSELSYKYSWPAKGSSPGGTLIHIYGDGFLESHDYLIGGKAVKSKKVIDSGHAILFSPPLDEGIHSLNITSQNGEKIEVKDFFEVFDEHGTFTNATGDKIVENIHISVIDKNSFSPIAEVIVVVTDRDGLRLEGKTNSNGKLTISKAGLNGPVSITAAKEEYEYASIMAVDADRITIAITPNKGESDEENGNQETVKAAVLEGNVIGVKYFDPNPNSSKKIIVKVSSAQAHVLSSPPRGGTVYTDENSNYRFSIVSLPGVVAVYAIFSVQDTITGEIDGRYIGILRKVKAEGGKVTGNLKVKLDLKLNNKQVIEFVDSPTNSNVALKTDTNEITSYLDLGKEGIIPIETQTDTGSRFELVDLPPVNGNNFIFHATASRAGTYPYSSVLLRHNGKMPDVLKVGPFLEIPKIVGPLSGNFQGQRKFEFQFLNPVKQNFHSIVIQEPGMGPPRTLWQMLVPGSEKEFFIPTFDQKKLNNPQEGMPYWYVISPKVSVPFSYNKVSTYMNSVIYWNAWTISEVNSLSMSCNVSAEICDGKDNNCDGVIDENCLCKEGQIRNCTMNTAECPSGTQQCQSGQWVGIP